MGLAKRSFHADKRGSAIVFAIIVGVVLGLLGLSTAVLTRDSSHRSVYISSMNRTSRLAETGLNVAISRLVANPNPDEFDTETVNDPEEKGEYSSTVSIVTEPINPIYYIVTSATRTLSRKKYRSTLHSYVRISNIADYFAVVSDELKISHPVDLTGAAVYAKNLSFEWDDNPGTLTALANASYLYKCVLSNTVTLGESDEWTENVKNDIPLSEAASGEPVKLQKPLLIPDLAENELERYKLQAGPHTTVSNFSGTITPPGYSDYAGNEPGDNYPSHTTDNDHHIYYSADDMYVSGEIFGQVLFVSEKNIYITSGIYSSQGAWLPGAGQPSSSTAHQAVLIANENVYISSGYYTGAPATTQVQKIEALIFAPNGMLIPEEYDDPATHAYLGLEFTGSLVLRTMNTSPNLPEVFEGSMNPADKRRTYRYMDSLKTHPPPYLPYVVEIHYCLEDVQGAVDAAGL